MQVSLIKLFDRPFISRIHGPLYKLAQTDIHTLTRTHTSDRLSYKNTCIEGGKFVFSSPFFWQRRHRIIPISLVFFPSLVPMTTVCMGTHLCMCMLCVWMCVCEYFSTLRYTQPKESGSKALAWPSDSKSPPFLDQDRGPAWGRGKGGGGAGGVMRGWGISTPRKYPRCREKAPCILLYYSEREKWALKIRNRWYTQRKNFFFGYKREGINRAPTCVEDFLMNSSGFFLRLENNFWDSASSTQGFENRGFW